MPNVALVPSRGVVLFQATDRGGAGLEQRRDLLRVEDGGGGFTGRRHILRKNVTSNPVEKGIPVSDHMSILPARMELEGLFTHDAERLWARLTALHATTEPLEVYTGWGVFNDMVITELRAEEPVLYGMAFTLKLTQILRGSVQVTQPPVDGPATDRSPAEERGLVLTRLLNANSDVVGEVLRERQTGILAPGAIAAVINQLPAILPSVQAIGDGTAPKVFPPYDATVTGVEDDLGGVVLTLSWRWPSKLSYSEQTDDGTRTTKRPAPTACLWRVQRVSSHAESTAAYTTPWNVVPASKLNRQPSLGAQTLTPGTNAVDAINPRVSISTQGVAGLGYLFELVAVDGAQNHSLSVYAAYPS